MNSNPLGRAAVFDDLDVAELSSAFQSLVEERELQLMRASGQASSPVGIVMPAIHTRPWLCLPVQVNSIELDLQVGGPRETRKGILNQIS
jgi:hypothetical protein